MRKRYWFVTAILVFGLSFFIGLPPDCSQARKSRNQALNWIRSRFHSPQLKIDIDLASLCSQLNGNYRSQSGVGMRTFNDALKIAIENLLTDNATRESALNVAQAKVKNLDLDITPAQLILKNLRQFESRLGLVGHKREDQAEGGEQIDDNWIFVFEINGFADLFFWVIVPRGPHLEPYNYGFN